jgi:hypothetical protein
MNNIVNNVQVLQQIEYVTPINWLNNTCLSFPV